jgi:tetratricopeptide (TPR) repeat protein
MASIVAGYEYDIFVSYRQKDNKGDMWVSEFVKALKTELESTFKEEISVYFDVNPHDGLLETHDVDASLKDKLKCIVFIPIISRTYCDPKSFAWEHEFKVFVEQASQDQFGLKIKLPGGNVANRILPLRIHDLDTEDIKLFEKEIGNVMRTLDFVFKTASGVNRPLKYNEDHPGDNLNKTYYHDQINKVALAIKEIIYGLRTEPATPVREKQMTRVAGDEFIIEDKQIMEEKPARFKKIRLSGVLITTILIIFTILAYPKLFNRNRLLRMRSSDGRISVVVMPFQNMTNDTTWNVWQDGIQNELITSLTNSEELKVRQTESINNLIQSKGFTNYASITPSIASDLSRKMDANVFIHGSIKQVGNIVRVNAQLIDSKTEEVYKSFQKDGSADKILNIIDSLSVAVKNFLIISKLEKEASFDFQHYASTNSPEAYKYFTYGNNAFFKRDWANAATMFSHAIDIDSNLTLAALMLSFSYSNQGYISDAKKWCLKAYEKREQMSNGGKTFTNWGYSLLFETPFEQIKNLKELQEIDDQVPSTNYLLADAYFRLYQYDKAIPELEKSLEIYKKWDSKPMWVLNYTDLGTMYHETGQYKKERKLYRKAEKDFPDDPLLIRRRAILALTERDTVEANGYIKKYVSLLKDRSFPDAVIANNLGVMNEEAGIPDIAEEYYRKALSLDPENPFRMNNLAYFLINKDKNINEGMELVDRALKINPDSFYILDTKGWGLYKQGKYKEALVFLNKCWDLRPLYDRELYLHLQEAKKAAEGQKN